MTTPSADRALIYNDAAATIGTPTWDAMSARELEEYRTDLFDGLCEAHGTTEANVISEELDQALFVAGFPFDRM